MQEYWVGSGESARHVVLPRADDEVVPGVRWGRAEEVDTAAYWALRCANEEHPLHGFVSAESDLLEEIGFCILGGFGVRAEINGAAFERLRANGVFDLGRPADELQIRDLLLQPLSVEGRQQRYRFPNQRARRIIDLRTKFQASEASEFSEANLPTFLKTIEGIGPKTAAWIVRNHFGSDEVAIIDVHVIRACKRLKVFPQEFSLPRDYEPLQTKFLDFARAIKVKPSVLDAVMWTEMRSLQSPTKTQQLVLI